MWLKKLKPYLNFPLLAAISGMAYVIIYSAIDHIKQNSSSELEGKTIIYYWEKWSGAEYNAMKSIVDDFNKSQDNIYVKMLSVSSIEQKLMLATAGGAPPDVAGVWSHTINTFARKGALTPLDGLMKRNGIKASDYIPVFIELCQLYGFTWALPTTPGTVGLHWNKKLFREAGLDPESPPQSIAELDKMAEMLTIVKIKRKGINTRIRYSQLTEEEKDTKDFSIVQLGYSPSIPGWYNEMWGFWFGAKLWNGKDKICANSLQNIEALQWYGSFAQKYGIRNLQEFGASCGNFASPSDPFLSEKVAMVQQGVWMYNFINKFSPAMEWGAAAFPSADPARLSNVCIAETDVLVIPRGSKHIPQAFEFIKYTQKRKVLEKLNLAQRKFPPLADISDDFYQKHPNKYIKVFVKLSESKNAKSVPAIPIWNEYKNEFIVAYDQAFTGITTPATALENISHRVQLQLDRVIKRWELVKERRFKEWRKIDDQN
ncbi:MAG: ABC transporter substrate-binding protein [Victivallales bacterium]|nr:ABC transporter substrate-binding protein [Victivallales bacterium]